MTVLCFVFLLGNLTAVVTPYWRGYQAIHSYFDVCFICYKWFAYELKPFPICNRLTGCIGKGITIRQFRSQHSHPICCRCVLSIHWLRATSKIRGISAAVSAWGRDHFIKTRKVALEDLVSFFQFCAFLEKYAYIIRFWAPEVSEGCRYDTPTCDVLRGATMPPVNAIKKTYVIIFNIDSKFT